MIRLRMQAYKLHRGLIYDRNSGYSKSHFDKGDKEYHTGYLVYREISDQIKLVYIQHFKQYVQALRIRNTWDGAWGISSFEGKYSPFIYRSEYEKYQQDYIMNCTILGEEPYKPFDDVILKQQELVEELRKLVEPKRQLILKQYKKQTEKEYGRYR